MIGPFAPIIAGGNARVGVAVPHFDESKLEAPDGAAGDSADRESLFDRRPTATTSGDLAPRLARNTGHLRGMASISDSRSDTIISLAPSIG